MDFEEHADPVAGSVFVVVTKVPQRRPGDYVDLIEFQAVRERERREINGRHQHPRVRFDVLGRRLTEMHGPRHVRSAVCAHT